MKDLFFDLLYTVGFILVFSVGATIVTVFLAFVHHFIKNLNAPKCGHHMRQMTDKVGSPITCLDCGKILEQEY